MRRELNLNIEFFTTFIRISHAIYKIGEGEDLKRFIFAIVVTLFMLSMLLTLNINAVQAQDDYVVKIGEDKIFTSCNFHNTETAAAPYHPSQGSPSIMEATSNDQLTTAHILANAYQEGYSKGLVGVAFAVEANTDGQEAMLADVSITFDYSLNVDFQVPPPSENGGGSANAEVYGSIAGNQEMVDQINFVHYSDSADVSSTKTLTRRILLQAGNIYSVFANIYSSGDVYIGGYANSQSSAMVTEVRVTFVDLNVVPETPLGTAIGLSVMLLALSLFLGAHIRKR